ncbi:TPM domain-containing protein [Nocardia puris]|uniref:TPM domain-containing protein n=1 Tax=Nocardia puris TaxID=208602 RepID=UPI002E1C3E46
MLSQPSRLATRSARTVALLFLLITTALAGAPAVAEPPARLDTYVVDRAGALGGDQARVGDAVNRLYDDRQIRLWITYVRDFDGLTPQSWAGRTATASGFGDRDVLLAVATGDREYWFDGELPSGVSESELDRILTRDVEPALRDGRWADAGVATADGLNDAAGAGGVSVRGLFIAALVIALAVAALVFYSRKRRRDRNKKDLAAARQVDPTDSAAVAALPLEALHTRSTEMLVEIDDALRTSAEELELAVGEFGATATTPFTTALENAKAAAARAFTIRQQLDDDIPETPDEQRRLLVELIGAVGRADRELDARVAEFDAMRDLLINAPSRLDALTRDLVELTGRAPTAEAELTKLTAAYPASVLAPISDNVRMARERITFAEQNVDAGRQAMAQPVGAQGGAVAAIRAAESAVGQARTLLDAVDNAAANIQQARDGIPAALTELEGDIAAAAELTQFGGPELERATAAARQALDRARTSADSDPLGAFHAAVAADADLDRAIAAATDRKLAAEDLRRRLDRALTDARARIGAASDFITTRRGGVDVNARTRLSEAQRNLDEAQRLDATDPARALPHAQAAADLGGRALQEAHASVRAWESNQTFSSSGAQTTGAVLGGILVEGLLRGAASGSRRSGGGYRPRSFGGSGGSRRVGRGGRF